MPCPQPDDPASQPASGPSRATACVRCKANPAIAIFRDSIYCQACALAVFDQKAKSGLELARGAGLARYVAAAQADANGAASAAASTSSSSAAPSSPAKLANANGDMDKRPMPAKQVNNGGGNAEVNVSANVAIAFSGGPSSRALLRTAVEYFRPESSSVTPRIARRRKGRGEPVEPASPSDFDATSTSSSSRRGAAHSSGRLNEVGKIFVLYIDDSAVIPNDGGVDRTETARKMVEDEDCPDLHFVPLKLEDIYRTSASDSLEGVSWTLREADTQCISSTPTTVSDPVREIKALFSSLHPPTTPRTGASSARTRVEDLHRTLISALLVRTAHTLSCSSLLLADSATRISIRLIEDLAKGAGHKLPVQGSDAVWIDDLLVVRPLKAHLLQEVLFYTQALGLDHIQPEQHVVPPTVSTSDVMGNANTAVPVMDKSSISRLTETFVLNLEKGVPSTVTTIGKTGSKLVLNAPSLSTSSIAGAEGVEGASRSTLAFKQVGPSVSLRHRSPGGVMQQMANLSIGTRSDASTEPRIGSRGIKLAQTSAACFHWQTQLGCALCGMPSQHPHARHWKRNITISSLAETSPAPPRHTEQYDTAESKTEAERGRGRGEWIDLADHLCYACLLVLAPPTRPSADAEEMCFSLLPAYVLERIQRRRSTTHQRAQTNGELTDTNGSAAAEETAANGDHAKCASHTPAPQLLKRSEIKAKINEFLLDDE